MKNILAVALFAASVAGMSTAEAKKPKPTDAPAPSVACSVSDVSTISGGMNALACFNRSGNDNGSFTSGVTTYLNSVWGATYGSFTNKGFSEDAGFGPFTSHPNGASSGTLMFDSPGIFGFFVISLKGGPGHTLYLMDAGANGATGVNFSMAGTPNGSGNGAAGFSHGGLWQGRIPSPCVPGVGECPDPSIVPEPTSVALMFGGLLGLGVAARRRRKA